MIKQIELAQRLKKCQTLLRKLFPDIYEQVTGELRRQIREIQAEQGGSVLEIAIKAATGFENEGKPELAMWTLAAACEEIEAGV